MSFDIANARLPVRLQFEHRMTDAELLQFCEANQGLRVERDVSGEILVMTPANSKTSSINNRISRFLGEWAEADGRGIAFDSSGEFTLPDGSMRSPDAAWLLNSRWFALSEAQQSSFAPLCPEFVIELRSPTDKLSEAQAKMGMWVSNGAEVAWLIEPQRRVVEIHRPGDSVEQLFDTSSVQGTGLVAGFEFAMDRVWGH